MKVESSAKVAYRVDAHVEELCPAGVTCQDSAHFWTRPAWTFDNPTYRGCSAASIAFVDAFGKSHQHLISRESLRELGITIDAWLRVTEPAA